MSKKPQRYQVMPLFSSRHPFAVADMTPRPDRKMEMARCENRDDAEAICKALNNSKVKS